MDSFASGEPSNDLYLPKTRKRLTEVEPLYDTKGAFYQVDDGARSDTGVEALAKLRPVFDKPFGAVTAGNSAQITDGAALVIVVASGEAVEKYNLAPICKDRRDQVGRG